MGPCVGLRHYNSRLSTVEHNTPHSNCKLIAPLAPTITTTYSLPKSLFNSSFAPAESTSILLTSTSSSDNSSLEICRATLERIYDLNLQQLTSYVSDFNHFRFSHLNLQTEEKPQQAERSPDYYANVGDAIRTLREDIPLLFVKDLNYEIYREDILFKDPRNSFRGMKNYSTIFWSLRFHGRLFFKRLYVEVKRIWQPEDNVIKMRWTVHGFPRVFWEAEGKFDGISTYKLDKTGKVYEHSVDNVLLRDPPMVTVPPLLAGINLVPMPQQQPCPGSWFTNALFMIMSANKHFEIHQEGEEPLASS